MSIVITKIELTNSDDVKKLTVSLTDEASLLTHIKIDTQKSFICTSEPSSVASELELTRSYFVNKNFVASSNNTVYTSGSSVITFANNTDTYPYSIVNLDIDLTSLTGILSTLDLDNDMLFVFACAREVINSVTTTVYKVGVVFDVNKLFQKTFYTIDNLIRNSKDIPKEASDEAILFKSFQLSWSTADTRKFIYYWNKLHKKES